jgi:hypothetical protein
MRRPVGTALASEDCRAIASDRQVLLDELPTGGLGEGVAGHDRHGHLVHIGGVESSERLGDLHGVGDVVLHDQHPPPVGDVTPGQPGHRGGCGDDDRGPSVTGIGAGRSLDHGGDDLLCERVRRPKRADRRRRAHRGEADDRDHQRHRDRPTRAEGLSPQGDHHDRDHEWKPDHEVAPTPLAGAAGAVLDEQNPDPEDQTAPDQATSAPPEVAGSKDDRSTDQHRAHQEQAGNQRGPVDDDGDGAGQQRQCRQDARDNR